jgi:chitinase
MISHFNFPFTFSPLLAAIVLILSFMIHVIAAPTCDLIPHQVRATTDSPTPSAGNGSLEDVVATGWYAGWLGSQLPPSQISWDKYTALTFAFAITTPDPSMIALDSTSTNLLPTFVEEAHKHDVEALVSIGGWTGSIYFSSAVGNANNRTTFVKAVVDFAQKYKLDGVDFDWEYPGKPGIGCNTMSTSDSANFLSFLKELRQDPVGAKLRLTAAVGLTPFVGSDGNPMTDVSQFASVLDYIAIMNYDVWGSWSTGVGPNAPLDDSCAPTKAGSASSGVNAWKSAGFPTSKIVLAIAAYGHSFFVPTSSALDSSGSLAAYPQFDKARQPPGDSDGGTNTPTTDQCGNTVSGNSGVFTFKGMISKGFLDASGGPAQGINYRFDTCSQTPFVYQPNAQTMISYDNQQSFAAKGKFINNNGLAGFAIWEISGDSNNVLLSAISDAMGIVQSCS